MNNITVIGKVSQAQKDVTTAKGSTFTAFIVEDRNPFRNYPERVKICCWGNLRDKLSSVVPGVIVAVTGSASAEAYLGPRDQKPKAVITVNAREVEVISISEQSSEESEPAPAPRRQATGKPAPALSDGDGDGSCPF